LLILIGKSNYKFNNYAKKYEDQTKQEIYYEAKKVRIEGRSKMTKAELIKALRTN
jgi:hypothetical protein